MKRLLVLATFFVLSGCNEKVYDTTYYSAHIDEAQKVSEQCASGKTSGDNCKNANEAIRKEKSEKAFKEMLRH